MYLFPHRPHVASSLSHTRFTKSAQSVEEYNACLSGVIPPRQCGFLSPRIPYMPFFSPGSPQYLMSRASDTVRVRMWCFRAQKRIAGSVTPKPAAISPSDLPFTTYSLYNHSFSQYGLGSHQCCPFLNSVFGDDRTPFTNRPLLSLTMFCNRSAILNKRFDPK